MQKGICVAGNMIVDIIYPIEGYPSMGELTTISDGIASAAGGAVCNVIADLAQLDPQLPLAAFGVVGQDAEGDFIVKTLEKHPNVDLSKIKRRGMTSFTAVMSDNITKHRTFFQYRGANASFNEKDIPWDTLQANILHIGYILLLDTLDQPDDEYGTKMARLLARAQKAGIKTSIDIVSERGDRYPVVVPPALRYTDYCVINEIEAQQTTGIPLRTKDGGLIRENINVALDRLFSLGVSTWAIIHAPEGGFGRDAQKKYVHMDSLSLPKGYVKDTVGAGDAFCAGVLYQANQGKTLEEAIILGIASASCSLSEEGSTMGLRSAKDAYALYQSLR